MADDNTDSWMGFAQRSRDDGGLGLEPHQAAGLVGNLQNESGSSIPSWGPTGDNGSAWGTAQWRGDRLDNLKQYSADNGLDHTTVEAQQAFMRHEFDTTENKSYRALQAAQTPEDAATAVNTQYERSTDRSGRREQSARALMDGPTAIDAAMGRTRPTGSQAMAYADDGSTTPPALAPQQPPGALQNGGQPVPPPSNDWLQVLGQTLKNMAPGIAQDPAHAQVLQASADASAKANQDQGTWSHITLPNGQIARINSKQGIPQVMNAQGQWTLATGTYAKDDTKDPKWSANASKAADGSPVAGYVPPYAEWKKQQEEAATKPPASVLLGDDSQADGPDYYKTLDPVNKKIIDGWHDGTGMLPSPRDTSKPEVKRLIASAVKAYPDTDFANLPARQRLAKTLTDAAPGSNGGIITNSNTAIGILNDAADQHIALHNSGDYAGSSKLGNVNNWRANNASDHKRADILTHLAANGDDASGEITKVLTGGPGGVEERKTRSQRIANPNYVPSEAAGALEGELNDLASKHKQTVDKVREQMGQSYLDRFPVVEKTFKDQETTLRAKIEQLRAAGDAPPAGQSRTGVPMKDRPPLDSFFK
jgi:hypothetical protein